MNRPRKKDESFEDYKLNMKLENKAERIYLKGQNVNGNKRMSLAYTTMLVKNLFKRQEDKNDEEVQSRGCS